MDTAEALLRILRRGTMRSGEAMAKKLNVSRNAIWKTMNTLRSMGYKIDADAKGYTLRSTPDLLLPYELSTILRTKVMGTRIEHHLRIGSTNERAVELSNEGWPEGGLVISEEQSGGKGRLGRSWSSPPGGIWMSLILRPALDPNASAILTLAGGVAVAKVLNARGFKAQLKWPNDVLIGEKKVCGLLTEMKGEQDRVDHIVMGFGINANIQVSSFPKSFRENATSLLEEKGSAVDRKGLVADVLYEFEDIYDKGPKEMIARWKILNATIGRRVRISSPHHDIVGTAKDLTSTGALILRTDSDKECIVYCGDCTHLRND